MAEDKNSFQNILKLTSAMQAFETLLEASSLTPALSKSLGINDQLKSLRDTLARYVDHDVISVDNFRGVCRLCGDDVKIFDFDLKTSLEIHCRSEMHKIMAKNKEFNQNKLHSKLEGNTELSPPLLDLNNISNELKNFSINDVMSFKEKDLGLKQNYVTNQHKTCFECGKPFCTCVMQEKKPILLGEKRTNLHMNQKMNNFESFPPQIPLLLQGNFSVPPPTFQLPQQYVMVYPKQTMKQLPQKQKVAKESKKPTHKTMPKNPIHKTMPKNPTHKTTPKNTQFEKKKKTAPAMGIPNAQQAVNIHVHVGATSSQPLKRKQNKIQQKPKTTLVSHKKT